MSQEDVDNYRQGLDAFNRRDRAAFLEFCDPALENIPPRDWPEFRSIRGAEAVWNFFVEGNEPWEQTRQEISEVMEAGSDTIVALVRSEVQGKASGAAVPWSFWQVITMRDGKAVRFEWFTDRAEALKSAESP
jgi:ketosteroid isomerase-like protein